MDNTYRVINNAFSPGSTGTFWLPESGSINLSDFPNSTFYIYATAGGSNSEVINTYLNISLDGGTTFRRAEGYKISDAELVRGTWNSLDVSLMMIEVKLEIVITGEVPGALEAACVRKN